VIPLNLDPKRFGIILPVKRRTAPSKGRTGADYDDFLMI
jgi:hypothetical protein